MTWPACQTGHSNKLDASNQPAHRRPFYMHVCSRSASRVKDLDRGRKLIYKLWWWLRSCLLRPQPKPASKSCVFVLAKLSETEFRLWNHETSHGGWLIGFKLMISCDGDPPPHTHTHTHTRARKQISVHNSNAPSTCFEASLVPNMCDNKLRHN